MSKMPNLITPQGRRQLLKKVLTGGEARSLLRFTLYFFIVFMLLQWAYQALADSAIYRFYLDVLTVRPSAGLLGLIVPQDGVLAQSHRLVWLGGGLSVLNGCDGVEVMQLLIAAFVAVAGHWRRRLLGAVIGLLLIYTLNQARIVGLYLAVRHDRAWFELLHGLVGPLIIIAVTTLFFAWWIGRYEPALPV